MFKTIAFICTIMILSLTGCENYVARHFGGQMIVHLEEGERYVNATWKGNDNSLWITTVKNPSSKPQTYVMREHSMYGVLEGKVIIVEK